MVLAMLTACQELCAPKAKEKVMSNWASTDDVADSAPKEAESAPAVGKPKQKRGSVNMGAGIKRVKGQEEKEESGTATSSGSVALPVPAQRVPEQTPETPQGKRNLGSCFKSRPAADIPPPDELLKTISTPSAIFAAASCYEFCLFGVTTTSGRGGATVAPDFKEKELEVGGGDEATIRDRMAQLGMALCCKKGRKPEQPNQDNCFLCHTGPLTLCGVADGHGGDGHWVSHWVARAVLYMLLLEVEALGGAAPGQEVLFRIFEIAQQVLQVAAKRDRFDTYLSGTTLTVCIVDREAGAVCSVWCGDSRATVGLATGKAESLSKDHKPQDPKERRRIVASGGEVIRLEGDIPHRVFKRGGDVPGLAMSRAIGDGAGHEVGVLHEPDISRVALEPGGFVLCCSDGVWEFLKNSEATKIVHAGGRPDVAESCERLVQESRKRWLNDDAFMTDDITGIIVYM